MRAAEIEAFFEAAPPHVSEVLEAGTVCVADWLFARVEKIGKEHVDHNSSEQENRLSDEDVVAVILDTDGTLRKTFTLEALKSVQKKKFEETLGGAILIVDARLGGLKNGLLDAEAADPPPTADDSEWLGEGGGGSVSAAPIPQNARRATRIGVSDFALPVKRQEMANQFGGLPWTSGGTMLRPKTIVRKVLRSFSKNIRSAPKSALWTCPHF